MVQVQAYQIFNFPEVVEFLVIMSSEKWTLEFSLHYIQIAIVQRESCPAHNLVETSRFPTKENEFKQESCTRFHILLRREYLGQTLGQGKTRMLVFRNTSQSVMPTDNLELKSWFVLLLFALKNSPLGALT